MDDDLIKRKVTEQVQNDSMLIEIISIEIARCLNLEGNNKTLGRKFIRMCLLSETFDLFKERTIEYGQIRKEILIEIYHRVKQKYTNLLLQYKEELEENEGNEGNINEGQLFGFSGKTETLQTNDVIRQGGLRNKDTSGHSYQKPDKNKSSTTAPKSILGLDKLKSTSASSSRSKVGFSWNDDDDNRDERINDNKRNNQESEDEIDELFKHKKEQSDRNAPQKRSYRSNESERSDDRSDRSYLSSNINKKSREDRYYNDRNDRNDRDSRNERDRRERNDRDSRNYQNSRDERNDRNRNNRNNRDNRDNYNNQTLQRRSGIGLDTDEWEEPERLSSVNTKNNRENRENRNDRNDRNDGENRNDEERQSYQHPTNTIRNTTNSRRYNSIYDDQEEDQERSYKNNNKLNNRPNFENNDEFERYQNTIKQLNSDGIGAILTWIDLQHPLLKKYKFDPVEFLEGAKYSFIKVHSIIHSEEFNKYVNEEIEESENINFLKSNSTIRGFNSFIFYQKQHGLYSGSKETFHIIRLLRARIEVFEGKVEIENKPPSLDDFFKPPTPGLVGFEKVQNSSTNSKNNEESDEENIKDNSPVPPLTEKGVILSTLCAVEVKREEKNLGAKMIFYRLQGDISKGDDMEWKISDIYYPS